MNVSAADTASPRSVVAYAVAPIALAVVVDRVVAVIRRHVLADEEASAWTAMGRALLAVSRLAGVAALYSLRFVLAPPSTATGLRRMVLDAAPLPGLQAPEEPKAIDPPPTKKAALLALYRVHPDYGVKASAAKVAAELAPQAELSAGTARAYLYAEIEGEGVMIDLILARHRPGARARPGGALHRVLGSPDPADALADQAPPAPGPGFRHHGRAAVPLVAPGRAPSRPPVPSGDEAPPPRHLPHDAVRGPARPGPLRPPGVRPGRGSDDHPVAARGSVRPAFWPTG